MVPSTQSTPLGATGLGATRQAPPPEVEQPSSPQSAPPPPDWMAVINSTPRHKADAALAGAYAAALTTAAHNLPSPVTGGETIYPIPIDSTFGQWRKHLDALLASDDFKQWAHENRVDLSKTIRIFPPSDATSGWLYAQGTHSAPNDAGAGDSRSARTAPRAFGARFSNGQSLPASWPLILQAAKTLAAGQLSVSVPSPLHSVLDTHAERPARLEELAAFYGEQVPDGHEALTQRANQLRQATTFPLPGASLSTAQFEMRSEVVLEQQQRAFGDIRNNTLLCQRLSTAITPPPTSTRATDLPPSFVDSPETPEQATRREKAWIAQLLESDSFTLEVDPSSWYFQDEQLAPGARVSLKRFITDKGWNVPQTKDDINNLIKSIQRGSLPSLPRGNLTGALGWTAALTPDEKKQLYSHVRFNNLNLPGLGAAHAPFNNNGGAFNYLTQNRQWSSSELNAAHEVVEDILSSPKARELEAALQRQMGVLGDASGSDMTLAAILLGLDTDRALGLSKRNEIAGFDLANKRFYGQPLSQIRQALTDHLAESERTPARMAPVAAYMLLSSAAPELLVKDIPVDVTYGSPTWASLKATVAFIEAKSPGSASLMRFADVVEYGAIEPISEDEHALLNEARRETVIDWALVHGVLPPSPTGRYSDEQLNTAQTTFCEVMSALQTISGDLTAPVPMLKDMALEELGTRYKHVPLELAVITNPQARTNNATNNDLLHTNTGPYSLLDLYIANQAPSPQEQNKWYSLREQVVPGRSVELLHTLPDIKSAHRLAVTEHQRGRERGLSNLTRHLISQLPVGDRAQLEYGKLDIFVEGEVIKHRVPIRSGTLNLDESTPRQAPGKRSLIIRSTLNHNARFYEFCPQQNYVRLRDDLDSGFVPGPQKAWVRERSPDTGGEKYSTTAITEFGTPESDNSKLGATPPPTGELAPASYTSARSQFLGELLARHTLGFVDLEQRVSATGHATRFDDEDEEFETHKEALLASLIVVNPIRNVINGNWLALASDVLFDGVMYVTTAGLGKAASVIKPLNGALAKTGKPFGRRLFAQTPHPPANRLTDNFNQRSPGKTGHHDLADLASRPDIAQGTYRKGLVELSTPATFNKPTGKWYAVDSKTNKAYGKPLEHFTPQGSARLDDALPGPQRSAMSPAQRTLDRALGRDNVIQMGGPMRDLKLIGNEVHTFTDTYKGTKRLNIVAHGVKRNWVDRITGDGTKIVMDNTLYDAPGLATLLRSRGVDPATFDNVRLLVCYSAEGRSRAFGRLFQREINRPVKAFEGTVSLTHGSTSVTDVRNKVRSDVLLSYPQATPADIEQATDILTEGLFNGKATPHIQKNHGQTIRVNIDAGNSAPHYEDLKISYLPRRFTR